MESIKNKAAIIGMGCTRFGELWDKSPEDLIVEAVYEAYEDAGVEPKDIQAGWVGTIFSGLTALTLSAPLKLQYIPVTRVENMCATGSEALRAATYAVIAGACDIALAVGIEKLKDTGWTGLGTASIGESIQTLSGVETEFSAPAMFSFMATRYFHEYDIDPEEGKKLMAQIAVKNHHNGSLNPKAHYQQEITVDQALKSPIVAWPLGIFDCCGVSDGAAAAIVTRADLAKNFRDDPIYIKGLAISTGNHKNTFMSEDYDFIHVEETVRAGKMAYEQAGIKNPRQELSIAEVHDCFTIHEMTIYEDLGWTKKGKAREEIEAGTFSLGGDLPVNTDGGLKCFGHPLGASGLRMMYEVYKQLQEKAGKRQVKNPRLGLTHNIGGNIWGGGIGSVCIVGNQ